MEAVQCSQCKRVVQDNHVDATGLCVLCQPRVSGSSILQADGSPFTDPVASGVDSLTDDQLQAALIRRQVALDKELQRG